MSSIYQCVLLDMCLLIEIFIHMQLCVAEATHSFRWVNTMMSKGGTQRNVFISIFHPDICNPSIVIDLYVPLHYNASLCALFSYYCVLSVHRMMAISGPLQVALSLLVILSGIITFGFYAINKCDPIRAGFIKNPNQVSI